MMKNARMILENGDDETCWPPTPVIEAVDVDDEKGKDEDENGDEKTC